MDMLKDTSASVRVRAVDIHAQLGTEQTTAARAGVRVL